MNNVNATTSEMFEQIMAEKSKIAKTLISDICDNDEAVELLDFLISIV